MPGDEGMVVVEIVNVTSRRTRNRKTMVIVDVADRTGRLRVTFFNQPWRTRQLKVGMPAILFGRGEEYRGSAQMTNPIVDLIGDQTGRIVPVYPNSEKAGIGTAELTLAVGETLRRSLQRGLADPVPPEFLRQHDLIERGIALHTIHAPESMAQVDVAKRRLIYDELFRIQVALVRRKRELEASQFGVGHDCIDCCREMSAPARRSSRSPACWPRCKAVTRARLWPRPRFSPNSTTPRFER